MTRAIAVGTFASCGVMQMANNKDNEVWVPTGEIVEIEFGGKTYRMHAKAPKSKVQPALDLKKRGGTNGDDPHAA